MMAIRSISVVLSALICVNSPSYANEWNTIPLEARASEAPIPVVVRLAQSELHIEANPAPTSHPYGLAGGLVLVIINSAANKRGKEEVKPLLDALGPFDASAALMAGVRSNLSGMSWLTLVTDTPLTSGQDSTSVPALNHEVENYLVDVDCSYRIGLTFEALYAECAVRVVDKRKSSQPSDKSKSEKLLIDRTVVSEVALHTTVHKPPYHSCYNTARRETCRAQWMNNSAALLKTQLKHSLGQVGKMVGAEISSSGNEFDTLAKRNDNLILLDPSHSGYVIEGTANVQCFGRQPNFSSGFKPAILTPDSDGVMIVQKDGSLYHKRVLAVQ